jgi:hypothetical protein
VTADGTGSERVAGSAMAGMSVTVPSMLDPFLDSSYSHRFRGGRRDYQDSERSDNGYTGSTNDHTAPGAGWGGANDSTNNDQTRGYRSSKERRGSMELCARVEDRKGKEERQRWALPREGNTWTRQHPRALEETLTVPQAHTIFQYWGLSCVDC